MMTVFNVIWVWSQCQPSSKILENLVEHSIYVPCASVQFDLLTY